MQNTLRTTATQLKTANPIKISKTNISQKKKHENGEEEPTALVTKEINV